MKLIFSIMLLKTKVKAFFKNLYTLKISCMYFRVYIKFRVCTCIHDTRYTIYDIDQFRVYTVTSLASSCIHGCQCGMANAPFAKICK